MSVTPGETSDIKLVNSENRMTLLRLSARSSHVQLPLSPLEAKITPTFIPPELRGDPVIVAAWLFANQTIDFAFAPPELTEEPASVVQTNTLSQQPEVSQNKLSAPASEQLKSLLSTESASAQDSKVEPAKDLKVKPLSDKQKKDMFPEWFKFSLNYFKLNQEELAKNLQSISQGNLLDNLQKNPIESLLALTKIKQNEFYEGVDSYIKSSKIESETQNQAAKIRSEIQRLVNQIFSRYFQSSSSLFVVGSIFIVLALIVLFAMHVLVIAVLGSAALAASLLIMAGILALALTLFGPAAIGRGLVEIMVHTKKGIEVLLKMSSGNLKTLTESPEQNSLPSNLLNTPNNSTVPRPADSGASSVNTDASDDKAAKDSLKALTESPSQNSPS